MLFRSYFWRGVIFGFILGMLWASETMKVKMIFLIILGTILVGGIMGYFWTGVIFGFILALFWKLFGRVETKREALTQRPPMLACQVKRNSTNPQVARKLPKIKLVIT